MKTFKICNVEYKIKVMNKPFFSEFGEELDGEIDYKKRLIRIRKTHEIEMRKILIHEICHGIFRESHLGRFISADIEEVMVEAFAQNLFCLKW